MSAHIFRFGPFCLDTRERQLFANGVLVPLRGKVFDTLRVLTENPNRLMRKEDLMRLIWPEGVVEENNLDHNICMIRKALAQSQPGHGYIQTVPRLGYRFVAPVEAIAEPDQPLVRSVGPVGNWPVIVERERPLEQLRSTLHAAEQGSRHLVFVSGEPGVGKTTLIRQFLAEVDPDACWLAHGQCVDQHGGGEAYMPVLDSLSRLCRQARAVPVLDALNRYAPAWLANMPGVIGPEQRANLQHSLLGLTSQRMLRELVDAVEVLTANQLLLLVLDDLHWSDAATIDLLLRLASGHDPARLLILGAYRPGELRMRSLPLSRIVADMRLRANCTEISLMPLTMAACEKYLATRLPGIRPEFGELLFRRTGGNPLFATTVVDSWLSRGLLQQQNGEWIASVDIQDIAATTPDSLRNMIDDEVRQLSIDDREIVEAASAIGAELPAALITAAIEGNLLDVEARCSALADSGRFFVNCGAVEWPDGAICARYAFVHELYHELIYRRIPAGRRVRLHQQIGNRLESAFYGCEDRVAAELAIHFGEARDARRTIRYLRRAAEQCLSRGAPEEAVFSLTSALQTLHRIPEQPERITCELGIHALLAPALAAQKGFGDSETERAFRRAHELARKLGQEDHQFPVVFGFAVMLESRGEYRRAQELMEHYLPDHEGRCGFILEARDLLACSLFHQGAFPQALEHAKNGIAAYRPGQHSLLSASLGENPGIDCYSWTALCLWFLGFADQALTVAKQAISLAESPGHEYSLATAMAQLAFVYQLRQQPEEARDWGRATKELAARQGHSYRHSVGQVLHGWAVARLGQIREGMAELTEGISGCRSAGAVLDRPYHLALLAELYLLAGDLTQATNTLEEAIAQLQSKASFFYEAELWRLRGIVTSKTTQRGLATAYIERAVETARAQGAKTLQLRAITSLTRIADDKQVRARALKEISSTLTWFTEGFATTDCIAAKFEATKSSRTKAQTVKAA